MFSIFMGKLINHTFYVSSNIHIIIISNAQSSFPLFFSVVKFSCKYQSTFSFEPTGMLKNFATF